MDLVASNDHEANGLIENENRTLRSFFDRLRSCDKRSSTDAIVVEALYGKNVALGLKNASAFELLYGRKPRHIDDINDNLPPPISIDQHVSQ